MWVNQKHVVLAAAGTVDLALKYGSFWHQMKMGSASMQTWQLLRRTWGVFKKVVGRKNEAEREGGWSVPEDVLVKNGMEQKASGLGRWAFSFAGYLFDGSPALAVYDPLLLF